jgi:TolA-binding protein
LTGEAPKRHAASLDAVERALAARQRRIRSTRLWSGAGVAVLAGLMLLYASQFARPDALAFEVLRGSVAAAGFIDGTDQGTLLRFSDGTAIELAAGSRTRVGSLSAHGAEISLEHGRVNVQVVHLPGARWSVRAGAYLVSVTGTSFDVEFEPERRWLAIDLFTGSVSVTGPLIKGGLVVSAGQRLMVLPEDSLVLVQRDVPTPAAASAAAAPPATGVAPADGADAELARSADTQLDPVSPAPRSTKPRARARGKAGAPRSSVPESWSQLVVAGRFDEVLRQAEQRELDQVYREATFEDLQALADAARYARRTAVARAAFLALRERFAASTAAKEAAFFLGRLEEAGGAPSRALEWYDHYLASSPNGTYASQALGKKLLIIDGQHGPDAARPIARDYLQRFPQGPYAAAAAKLVAPSLP